MQEEAREEVWWLSARGASPPHTQQQAGLAAGSQVFRICLCLQVRSCGLGQASFPGGQEHAF